MAFSLMFPYMVESEDESATPTSSGVTGMGSRRKYPEEATGRHSKGQIRAIIYLTRPLVFDTFQSWNTNLRVFKKRLSTSRILTTASTTLLSGAGRTAWSVPVAEPRRLASTQIGALGRAVVITPSASSP